MKVAIIGAKGQLGSDLMIAGNKRRGVEVVPFGRPQLDVLKPETISANLAGKGFDAIINTSAYHQVDLCEDEIAQSFAVNAEAVARLADFCSKEDITLAHCSTDYVFSGLKRKTPYSEEDAVEPLSVYGASKVAGEQLLRYRLKKHVIVRSTGLYGKAGSREKGMNFPRIMLKLARAGKPLKVVADQTCTATPTARLAEVFLDILEKNIYGTFHATCQGETSWYSLAKAIFEIKGIKADISPVTSADYGAKAIRPLYSVLGNARLQKEGLDNLPYWLPALEEFLEGE